jgi:outer membrane receptor protein involved in Fe transport
MIRSAFRRACWIIAVAPCVSLPLAGQDRPPVSPDSVFAMPELTVEIGRFRTGSVPLAEVPFPVQIVGRTNFQDAAGSTVADALTGSPGISLTNQTGSTSQADIRIRGFALSPIVGVPQGVSVFVDGVRVNEADASQVHLSLIPEGAVERLELIRGPVGAFGRNSLAGALNIVTRRGMDRAVDLQIESGSFGLMKGTLGASGSLGNFDGFLSANYEEADGWRDLSGTEERSIFAKAGWRGDRTDAWLSYTRASHTLSGPGPLPESWLNGGALPADIINPPDDPRVLQYTGGSGDIFIPSLHFLNGRVERQLGDRWTLQGSAYGRRVDFSQSNDNITEPDALGLTDIRTSGSAVQLSYEAADGLIASAGTEWTRNHVEIEIREIPNRAFPSIPTATTERLATDEDNIGVFGEVWWRARPTLAFYGSLRFDYVDLPVEDLLDPSGSGRNQFSRLSGGLGLSKHINTAWNTFASFGRGFRAPVILEVMCADPDDPCQLPFELGPDPPLKAVVSDTWQAGLRVAKARGNGEVAVYWSEVHNDIFNVTDLDTPTRGFFTNLDRTRRLGAEAALTLVPFANQPDWTVSGAMGWTRATFQSPALLSAPFLDDDDPADPGDPADDGPSPPEVEPGDLFPMVPSLTGNLGVRYDTDDSVFALNGSWVGKQFLVGDEGNATTAKKLSRYSLLHASVERRFGAAWIYLRVSNILDADFRAYGVVSENLRGPNLDVERFLTPGQPRRFSAGVRLRLQG